MQWEIDKKVWGAIYEESPRHDTFEFVCLPSTTRLRLLRQVFDLKHPLTLKMWKCFIRVLVFLLRSHPRREAYGKPNGNTQRRREAGKNQPDPENHQKEFAKKKLVNFERRTIEEFGRLSFRFHLDTEKLRKKKRHKSNFIITGLTILCLGRIIISFHTKICCISLFFIPSLYIKRDERQTRRRRNTSWNHRIVTSK